MKLGKLSLAVIAFAVICAASVGLSQDPPKKSAIDPKADAILHELSNHNKQITSGVFRVTDTIDDVQEDGRKIQFAHMRVLTVTHPDKLKLETTGDVTNRTVWMDGKMVTVLDRDKNVYGELPEPGSINEAIDMLLEKYDMSLPAADLLSVDVYKSMTDGCETVDYVGLGYAGEEKCHHLAFVRGNIDWQLWVSSGEKPSVKKMVITYKEIPGEPQYTMNVLKADSVNMIDDSVFTAVIPKDAQKIEFHPAAGQ